MLEPPTADKSTVLSIIIVSWNVRELLRQCLHSIAEQGEALDLQVIVVDSASADGTSDMVAEQFPWVDLLAQDQNVGFPRGNNIGMNAAQGRFLFLLNPDTVVVGQALQQMIAYMEGHADVGLLGPQLRFPDGAIQSSRRRFPSLLTAFFESTWLEPWAPRRVLRSFRVEEISDDKITDVDWVTGAAMMVRRTMVDDVGPMDERYFMYSEELDWCRRIKAAGWRIVYYPEAEIIHYVGKSSEQAIMARHINFQRAKLRYFRKFHGRAACLVLRLFLLANYAWQLILELIKGLLGSKRSVRHQRIAVYWQVLRSGLPPAGY